MFTTATQDPTFELDLPEPLELDLEPTMTTSSLTTAVLRDRNGKAKLVRRLDPVFDTMEKRRARLSKVEPDGMLELCDNDGKVLPDLRCPSQVIAY